jgi:hypothetical protein
LIDYLLILRPDQEYFTFTIGRLFTVLRPAQEIFTYMETSPLPVSEATSQEIFTPMETSLLNVTISRNSRIVGSTTNFQCSNNSYSQTSRIA